MCKMANTVDTQCTQLPLFHLLLYYSPPLLGMPPHVCVYCHLLSVQVIILWFIIMPTFFFAPLTLLTILMQFAAPRRAFLYSSIRLTLELSTSEMH